MAKAKSTQTPDALLNDLRTLVAEAESLMGGDITDQARDKLEVLRERLTEAQERLGELYVTAKEKVTEGARRTDETIRAHPYESLAIALGIGVLLGALLRRNH
ncbi:MAG TPA: hypothetical protein PLN52_07910 [Opitutaceae bacterium]|nr:hypothetical protein [Opitutaceae bacterium]